MKQTKKIIFVSIILIITFIALSFTIFNLSMSKKLKSAKIAYSMEFSSKDPQKNSDGWSTSVTRQIVATLTQINKRDQVEFANAKEIKYSNNNKILTITLNDEYRWEDKVKIKAADYYFGLKHLLDPKTKSTYTMWATDNIVGANDYYNQRSTEIKGFKVLSDNKLQITLTKNVAHFTQLLASCVFSPLREDYYNKHKTNYGTSWNNVLSSGLYRIEQYKKGQYVQLVPNVASKKSKYLKINNILFTKVNTKLTEYKLFQQNKLNNFTQTQKIGKLEEDNITLNNAEMTYLIPNNKISNKNLNLALYNALDKKYISEKLLAGYGDYTATIYPNIYNTGLKYEHTNIFNLTKAKQYLKNIPKHPKIIKLLVGNDFNDIVLKYIVKQWKELGLQVEVFKTLPRLVNVELFKGPNTDRKYDFALSSWNANYNDIHAFTSEFINSQINYINKYDNKIANAMENVSEYTNELNMTNGYLLPLWQTKSKLFYRDNIISQSNSGYFLNGYFWN